jgi:hypothetical protein
MCLCVAIGAMPGVASGARHSTASGASRLIGASGLVVAYPDGDIKFCDGPMTLALMPGPPRCSNSIRARGVHISELSHRTSRRGVTWALAYLAGTFRNGTLSVISQAPPKPVRSTGPPLHDPPCAAPSGRWPSTRPSQAARRALDAYEARFPLDVASLSTFHPRPGASVLTIASTNPGRTRARLDRSYPNRLCVVHSRYQTAVVRHVSAHLTSLLRRSLSPARRYEMTAVGLTVSGEGQPIVRVDALVKTPELRAIASSEPAGLVEIVPWLRPASA